MSGGYVYGVDVGGTAVKLGLFTTAGELLEKWSIDTRVSDDERSILRDITASLNAKTAERGISGKILSVGMGVPGPALPDGIVNGCVNLGWPRFNVKEAMEELCGVPVSVSNDANLAALGEQYMGAAKGSPCVCMVTIGTGVGAGIIIDGRIVPGFFGAAGEIGHVRVYDDGDVCSCGNIGCFEQYSSANGIVRLAKRYIEANGCAETPLGHDIEINSINIFRLAREGDKTALGILEEMFDIFGRVFAMVSAVIDPELFVIGGGVSKEGEYLTEGIRKAFLKYCFPASRGAKVVAAALGNDAGIFGACAAALDIISK